MAANLKVGNAIFCEYTARGEGGKFLLVNVYSGDIIVPVFPSHILAALYFEFFPGEHKDLEAKLEFYRGEMKLFEALTHFAETKSGEPAIVNSQQFLLPLDGPTTIRAVIAIKGFKSTQLLTKKVQLLTSSPTV
jgi:hypothetical protein